jgi:hypothetical protein
METAHVPTKKVYIPGCGIGEVVSEDAERLTISQPGSLGSRHRLTRTVLRESNHIYPIDSKIAHMVLQILAAPPAPVGAARNRVRLIQNAIRSGSPVDLADSLGGMKGIGSASGRVAVRAAVQLLREYADALEDDHTRAALSAALDRTEP